MELKEWNYSHEKIKKIQCEDIMEELTKISISKSYSTKVVTMTAWLRRYFNIFLYVDVSYPRSTVIHTYRFQIDSLSAIDAEKYCEFNYNLHIFL